jgi:hypothetical protein
MGRALFTERDWADVTKNKRKSPFLTIQLLLKFGFGHQTPKLIIFGHPTIKTVQIYVAVSIGGFNCFYLQFSL